MNITLRLPYPISANLYWRTRVQGKRAITYVSKEAEAFKKAVRLIANCAGIRVSDSPIQLSILLHPKITKAGIASLVCLDLDNSQKVTIDSLKGIAYVDDKQVRRISAEYADPVQGGGMTVNIREFV